MGDAFGSLGGVVVGGISCVAPDNPVSNESFTDRFGESIAKFAVMTGVKHRFFAGSDQTASDLAFVAARRLFEAGLCSPDAVDALVFVSEYPDYFSPATACVLQHRLGLKTSCLAFDMNMGCSGFITGMFTAASICKNEGFEQVLLCGGSTPSKVTSPEDKSTAMLMGDAGFAVSLKRGDLHAAPWHYLFRTEGSGFRNLVVPAGGFRHPIGNRERRVFGDGIVRSDYDNYMDGMEVFKFAITEPAKALRELMGRVSKTPEDYDFLVLHQANLFIQRRIGAVAGFPMNKVPVSIDRFGNTVTASIPLTICDALTGAAPTGQKRTLTAGYGVGLSWGVLDMPVDPATCLPIGYSNEYFRDNVAGFEEPT